MFTESEWTPEQMEKRRIIMDAARSLFAREGRENVSMRRIANKINYSPAIIYRYFKNKEELLHQLRCEGIAMLTRRMLEVQMPLNPLDKLVVLAEVYVQFGLEMWEYYDLMFHSPLELQDNELLVSNAWSALDLIRETVEQAMEEGYFAGQDPDSVYFMCWSMVHGLVSLHISGRIPFFLQSEEQQRKVVGQIPLMIFGMARQLHASTLA